MPLENTRNNKSDLRKRERNSGGNEYEKSDKRRSHRACEMRDQILHRCNGLYPEGGSGNLRDSNFSNKLDRGSFRYLDARQLANVLGYEIIWRRRRDD